MPINRVPIIHKFGIISQSQRDELEERIAQKTLSETQHKLVSQQALSRHLPFEVTDDFVFKFNDSSQEERIKLEDTAFKMLKRLRRLTGLRDAGEVHHADLHRAWIDLALLAQCQSYKLEDACLETIIASLDQASVSEDHILSLFYLAKSGIHWLKRDSFNQAVLRSSEIKLLKMTRLVFFRLYCHFLLGQLQEYEGQQTSLAQYLKGFSEKINSYNQFPGAELSIRFIIEAGSAICDSSKSTNSQDRSSTEQPGTSEKTLHEVHWLDRQDTASIRTSHFVKNDTVAPSSSKFTFLWHCINVWHVANNETFRVNDALHGLFETPSHLANEPWLDIVFAFYILADACRHNARILNAFQYLISLDFSTVPLPLDVVPLCDTCYSGFSNTRDKKMCNSMLTAEDSPSCNTVPECQGSNYSPNVLEKLKIFVDCGLQEDTLIHLGLERETKRQTIPTCQGNTGREEHTRSEQDDESSETFKYISAALETCGNIGYDTRYAHDAESLENADTTGAAGDAKEYEDIGGVNQIIKSGDKEDSSRKTYGMVGNCDFSKTSRTKDVNENELLRKLSGEQFEVEKKEARLTSVEIMDENRKSSRIHERKNDFRAIPNSKQMDMQKRCTNSALMDTSVENSPKHENKNNISVESGVEGDQNSRNSSRRNYLSIGQTLFEQYTTEKKCLDSVLVETIVEDNEKSQTTKAKQNLPNASHSSATETQKPSYRWPWELVYTFCECMTSICLHGVSSNIQKAALLGDGNEGSIAGRYGSSMSSRYGLINFLEYDDWRIRYAAVQGLVLVSRHHYDDVTKGGLENAAWSSLMRCQAREEDGRVLDAIKVGKVEADLQNNLVKDHIPISLWTSRIAAVLSQTILPQAKLSTTTPTLSVTTARCSVNKFTGKPAKAKRSSCTKPSLRQEISLSHPCRTPRMNYGERMNLELRSVVEDQWKKQLLEEMEEELKTNLGELEKQKKEELLKTKMDALTLS